MTQITAELQKQLRQAEEFVFSGPEEAGFAKGLFFGRFETESLFPYPQVSKAERALGDQAVAAVQTFCADKINPAQIDRNADIPADVIRGLGDIGVLGATIPKEYGGQGLSQQSYCRVMEVLGGHDASVAVFVNAHHSIGLRSLVLFGTDKQKSRYLRALATGGMIAAFALTEEQAGSDAGNVQTRARIAPDGKGYILNGTKRYITNAAIAQVLTVMARTPDPADDNGKVTAFIVTPDMAGFQLVEGHMEKCGIRGTATGKLAFNEMFVPKENVLGQVGKGLRQALTVLDFGRVTFGASCTGAAKFCLQKTIAYANSRKQFGRTLGSFDLVKEKIAQMAANTFAMESATYYVASLIDKGAQDFMLETAALKVFASDALWTIVNDALQIHGGAGYFTDQPFERMMRDARINTIGEGANDVLRCFVAAVGLRPLGLEMQQVMRKPWTFQKLLSPGTTVPVVQSRYQPVVSQWSRQIKQFARACQVALFRHREGIVEQQSTLARIGDIAIDLFLCACTYSRIAALSSHPTPTADRDIQAGLLFLKSAVRRNAVRLAALKDNDDSDTSRTADAFLGGPAGHH